MRNVKALAALENLNSKESFMESENREVVGVESLLGGSSRHVVCCFKMLYKANSYIIKDKITCSS